MSFSPTQCRAARALLNWSQSELAQASQVATKTIADYERGDRTPYERTIADIRAALEDAGVQFTNGERPGVGLDLVRLHRRNADLRSRIDEALKLVDKSVSSKVDSIRAEFFKSHEEPQLLLESFARLRHQQRVLEAAGVKFTNGDRRGVRLKANPQSGTGTGLLGPDPFRGGGFQAVVTPTLRHPAKPKKPRV